MVWVIYTNSIDAEKKQAAAGWGCVVISPAKEEKIGQGVINFENDKAHRAGLMALVRALCFVPEGEKVEIASSDQQIINGLAFRKNISSTNAEAILSTANLWQQLYTLIDARKVSVFGIDASGSKAAIDRARALAQEALDAYASGQMPTSTPTITEYELAGSPGSGLIGCSGWAVILIVGAVVGALVALLKWVSGL